MKSCRGLAKDDRFRLDVWVGPFAGLVVVAIVEVAAVTAAAEEEEEEVVVVVAVGWTIVVKAGADALGT